MTSPEKTSSSEPPASARSGAENEDGSNETSKLKGRKRKGRIRKKAQPGDDATGGEAESGSGNAINDGTIETVKGKGTKRKGTKRKREQPGDAAPGAVAVSGSGNVIKDGITETVKGKGTKRKGTKRKRGNPGDDATEAVAASESGNVINDGTNEPATIRHESVSTTGMACDTVINYEIPQPRTLVPFCHNCGDQFDSTTVVVTPWANCRENRICPKCSDKLAGENQDKRRSCEHCDAETAEQGRGLEKYNASVETQRQNMGEINRQYEDDLKSGREAEKLRQDAVDRFIKETFAEGRELRKDITEIRKSNRKLLIAHEYKDLAFRNGDLGELQVPPPELITVPNSPASRVDFSNDPHSRTGVKQRPKSFGPENSAPAKLCHGCNRNMSVPGTRSVVCANNKTNETKPRATCKKVMCETCIDDSNTMIPGGCSYEDAASNPNWICTHCTGKCLKRAKCSLDRITIADRSLDTSLKRGKKQEIEKEEKRRKEESQKITETDDTAFERYKKAVEMENERCKTEKEADEKQRDEEAKKIEEARMALKKKFEKDQEDQE